MRFFERSEEDDEYYKLLESYDDFVNDQISTRYDFPIRMRYWELVQVLRAVDLSFRLERVMDTGSVNTFLGFWLSRICDEVIVSDLLPERVYKNILRRIGVLKRKKTEANIETWFRTIKSNPSIRVRSVDLTRIQYPDCHFDLITSISVIEHVPDVEKAISEMYRCLKVGGKLLLTTDCSPTGKPLADGARYFSHDELKTMFSGYPVSSEFREPDFKEENWCYRRDQPLLMTFLEITKD